MCSCEKKCRLNATFIIIMIYGAAIIIMSIIQLCNKRDYGYKNSISNLRYFIANYDLKNTYCDKHLSDIKFKRKFAEGKTVFNLLYNLYLFIFGMLRLNDVQEKCKLGILFSFILLFGNITELVLTSISLSYFDSKDDVNDENYYNCNYYDLNDFYNSNSQILGTVENSNWVSVLDAVIISLSAASVIPISYLFCVLFCQDCDSYNCIEKDFFWLCYSICDCLGDCCGLCGIFCDGFSKCCDICNGNENSSLKDKNDKLFVENNNLRTIQTNLESEVNSLKKQKNLGENNFKSEREKYEGEIQNFKNKGDQNLKNEQNLNEEINNFKTNNDNLEKEIEKLKKRNQKVGNDMEIMENKLIHENIELKQLNVIQYYVHNKHSSGNYDKNNYIKNIALKELEEINYKYGVNIDSNKFKERCLYYISKKLTENLTDPETKEIFLKPVITQDGKTCEEKNLNNSNNYIENKLVLQICKILKESGEELTFDNFKIVKKLLISKETGKYYKNPVVVISGVNKGETIEDIDNENKGYQNKVIINIIEDIKELLDDDFFKFEMIETNGITTNDNNINAFNIIGFGDV